MNLDLIKDHHYHAFPHTEFSHCLNIDTSQYELPNYLLKIGGIGHKKAAMMSYVMTSFSTKWLITQKLWDFKGWCN